MTNLKDIKVALLSDTGFEESELTSPKKALEDAGAQVDIISAKSSLKGWSDGNWTGEYKADVLLKDADPSNYNALLIPGGVINPDKMRRDKDYVVFARSFMESGKPVAAICHGPQLLIETGLLKGREMTSFASIKTDLINAGAEWRDEEVVVDNGLVTSRSPEDLPAFNKKIIEEFAEGIHSTNKSFVPTH